MGIQQTGVDARGLHCTGRGQLPPWPVRLDGTMAHQPIVPMVFPLENALPPPPMIHEGCRQYLEALSVGGLGNNLLDS